MTIFSRLFRLTASLTAVFLLGGFAGALLIRYAPGFEADERQLDPRLGAEALRAAAGERAAGRDIGAFYVRHLRGLAAGDFGESVSLRVPVRDLVAERAPLTAHLAGTGLAAGWLAGLAAAGAAGMLRIRGAGPLASLAAALATSVPVALFAFAVLFWELPVWLCIAAAVFPRVYRYTRNALDEQWARMPAVAALARGVSSVRVAVCYVALPTLPRTVALAGVTVSMALGAAIPVEVLADVPGVGQLAWKAASGRDLPVLVTVTMMVTAVTLVANALADLGVEWLERSPS